MTSRRTVVAGIEWATPVIAIATAAPAMAASAPVVIRSTGIACKRPGGSCAGVGINAMPSMLAIERRADA